MNCVRVGTLPRTNHHAIGGARPNVASILVALLVVAAVLCTDDRPDFSNLNALAGEAFNLMWCPPFTASLPLSICRTLHFFENRGVGLLDVKNFSN